MTTKHICVACNEDGFGPSAFVYYVVRAIVEKWREEVKNGDYNFELKIWVLNEAAYEFNCGLYSDLPEVCPKTLDSLIKLKKCNGEVHVPDTLDYLKRYENARQSYNQKVQFYLENCNIAIDIGVPLFVRSAEFAGVNNVITLFDHSWARTLIGICSDEAEYDYNPNPTLQDRDEAERLAAEIASDEARATEVFLFQHYITPPEFRKHWEGLQEKAGFKLDFLRGVLGNRHDPKDSLEILNQMFDELKQKPVLKGDKLVLISPGGTPVWDDLLPQMIDQYIARNSSNYILVFSNPKVKDEYKNKMKNSPSIRWYDFVPRSTQQIIMPAFKLVVTRAGGGTVNDCLASNTPFVCVEEHQWQVRLIERECKNHKPPLIPEFEETQWENFKSKPMRRIDKFFKFFDKTKWQLPKIDAGAESWLVDRHIWPKLIHG
ncbi:MAG: glycosyltransferase [Bacteroidetes bacterium]|nr:glycosyltransferase [Bacteroidota bacterium]